MVSSSTAQNQSHLRQLLLRFFLISSFSVTSPINAEHIVIYKDRPELDLSKTQNMFDYVISRCIHRTLVKLDKAGNIEADAAKSWSVSSDRLTYTFELKKLKYHDGSGFNPKEASESLNKSIRSKSDIASILRPYIKWIKPQGGLLIIKLNQPFDPFLKAIASSDLALIKTGKNKSKFEIGLGQFKYKEIAPDRITLQNVMDVARSINIDYSKNTDAIKELISSKSPDAVLGLPSEIANNVVTSDLILQNINNFTFTIYLVNSERPIAGDESARRSINRAVELAINDFFVTSTGGGHLEKMVDVMPKGIFPNDQPWIKATMPDKKWHGELKLAFPVNWLPEEFGTALLKRIKVIAPKAELVKFRDISELDFKNVDYIQSDYILPFPDPEGGLPAYSLQFFGISDNSAAKKLKGSLNRASKMTEEKRLHAFQLALREFVNDGWAIPLFTSKVSILTKKSFFLGEGEYQFESLLCH